VPWLKPWRDGGSGQLPANAFTKRSYSGINIVLLWYEAELHSYPTHLWLTYRQAKEQGGSLRKGEKGTHIVFTKPLLVKSEKIEDDPKKDPVVEDILCFQHRAD